MFDNYKQKIRTLDNCSLVRYNNSILTYINMEPLNVTTLRKQIYKAFDKVIETGEPIPVTRKGYKLMIVLADDKKKKQSKFDRLIPHDAIVGNPDDLVNIKVGEWHELENL